MEWIDTEKASAINLRFEHGVDKMEFQRVIDYLMEQILVQLPAVQLRQARTQGKGREG